MTEPIITPRVEPDPPDVRVQLAEIEADKYGKRWNALEKIGLAFVAVLATVPSTLITYWQTQRTVDAVSSVQAGQETVKGNQERNAERLTAVHADVADVKREVRGTRSKKDREDDSPPESTLPKPKEKD